MTRANSVVRESWSNKAVRTERTEHETSPRTRSWLDCSVVHTAREKSRMLGSIWSGLPKLGRFCGRCDGRRCPVVDSVKPLEVVSRA